MYLHAESVKLDTDEGRFVIEIESASDAHPIVIDIHDVDLDAFAQQVSGRLGPYLWEMHEARVAVASGVTLEEFKTGQHVFECDPDESGGYDTSDPKHPDFHSIHADIYDSREGK